MQTLKDKKVIESIFSGGKSISSKLVFAKYLDEGNGFLFAVSKKKFKRVVDRNRIKRLMRESVKGLEIDKSIAFIFIGDTLPTFNNVKRDIEFIVRKITK